MHFPLILDENIVYKYLFAENVFMSKMVTIYLIFIWFQ